MGIEIAIQLLYFIDMGWNHDHASRYPSIFEENKTCS